MAPFKVAIVGGGMTGLTAALHLDRVGIDFILLEAYPDITPEVGASLALYPNFQRALNQLGVLDEALKESSELCHISCRNTEGKIMFQHDVKDALHESTGGYGIATFTRAQLLKILYRNISEEGKKKIHTSQKVSKIEQLPGDEGVRLHLEGGRTHDADVVIGADGTHSIVRSEMWRLAQELDPKAFKDDQGEDSQTEFGCVFGLSTKTGDLDKKVAYQVSSQDMTIGVFGGPNGEACWFVFFKVQNEDGKPFRGAVPPKLTQEQGTAILEKYSGAKLTESTTFGDVYANQHRVTTQPCPNHCLRRWTAGRLICLGDSVAKTNPILAQGGAQGAESVLTLIDRLDAALEEQKQTSKQDTHGDFDATNSDSDADIKASKPAKLSTSQIETILSTVNKERYPRVRAAVDKSQQIICVSAWSNWLFRIVGKYIAPLLPTWVIVAQALGQWNGAYSSTSLPAPKSMSTA